MKSLQDALWKIYKRAEKPQPWQYGGNLPWDDPDFSRRMLREHLDDSHGAASRQTYERNLLIDFLYKKLRLRPNAKVLDITCGPGLYAVELASRGCQVTGIDFSPAAISHARRLAAEREITDRCTFFEKDVRLLRSNDEELRDGFDAAIFIYGQLAVFPVDEANRLLAMIADVLNPGGLLCVELLNEAKIDKADSSWWFTDNTGLWGDKPFLHLGERYWLHEEKLSIERFQILQLENGKLDTIVLCDQAYESDQMMAMLKEAGFSNVELQPAWGGLPLNDAEEWIAYVAEK